MKTQEEQLQEAREAQTSLRGMVVAAGILSEPEAVQFVIVRVGDKSKLVHLPAGSVPTECDTCGCDMHDSTFLEIGIDKAIGEEKFHAIVALLDQTGAEN